MAGSKVESRKSKVLPRAAFAIALLPFAWLLARALVGRLGANPIAEVLNQLGFWALIFLLSSLACTPLQIVFRWKWPLRLRRMLGLFAFFTACGHFVFYAVVDQGLDLNEIGKDLVKRKFIAVGMATLLVLLPLAVTSTDKWMRRLGFHRWKALHRLAYLAGVLAVVHFVWRVKKDLTEPLTYASILALLLIVRVVRWWHTTFIRRRKGVTLAA
jgi:sulfoxide reductase heme-binding subunit YedZ